MTNVYKSPRCTFLQHKIVSSMTPPPVVIILAYYYDDSKVRCRSVKITFTNSFYTRSSHF